MKDPLGDVVARLKATKPPQKIIRECLNYFPDHQGAILIIKLEGELIENGYMANLVPDIILLGQQGIKQVLIHGINAQLRKLVQAETQLPDVFKVVRTTDPKKMEIAKEACMRVNWEISTALSSGAHTGTEIKTITGHLIKVRKIESESGGDFQLTVDVKTLQTMLDANLVPIISPLGVDEMGNILILNADFLAAKVAAALGADKLIFLTSSDGIFDQNNELVREKTPSEMRKMLDQELITGDMASKVKVGLDACENGVPRIHFVNGKRDGSILLELFTIDGSGSMIYADSYKYTREAELRDIQSIFKITRQFATEYQIIQRKIDEIKGFIDNSIVYEKDGLLIGFCALTPYPEGVAEIVSLAVAADYQQNDIGVVLIQKMEDKAKEQGIKKLFALPIQNEQWYVQRGFLEVDVNSLPEELRTTYNLRRISKAFQKNL